MAARRFRVAPSFSGNKREYVGTVAECSVATLGKTAVLYDEDLEAELATPNMEMYLGKLYREHSALLVPCFSSDYEGRSQIRGEEPTPSDGWSWYFKKRKPMERRNVLQQMYDGGVE